MPRVALWRASIILTGALAVALTLAALAGGLVLLLLPVLAVGAVAYRVIGKQREGRWRKNAPHPDADVIEGEFVVIADEPANGETRPLNEEPRQR
jgi:hypothetical protein